MNYISKLIKNFFPKTLYKRFLLIIIIPITFVQIISMYFFINRNWYESSAKLSYRIISEINYISDTYENNKKIFDNFKGKLNDIQFSKSYNTIQSNKRSLNIGTRLFKKFLLQYFKKNNINIFQHKHHILLYLHSKSGTLEFIIPNKSFTIITNKIFVFWTLGFSLILVLIAWLFMRNQVNPIISLAKTMRRHRCSG